MTSNQQKLIEKFNRIVGLKNVLTRPSKTLFYRQGFRFGLGNALAVVAPGTILEQWLIIKACVESGCVIIMQAANTGLTGGSTPSGKDYDRSVIIINTIRINQIHLIDNGNQAVSLSGATLHNLETILQETHRAPHSVIGSSQIGATVVGGIANNSGGALVKRGPAYTEFALYAQVDKNGSLNLVNHLGIGGLGDTPEEILANVQSGNINSTQVYTEGRMASDSEYVDWIRNIESDTPARFNADSRRLFEASGCAGKVGVFAVRTDTFAQPESEQVFYIGSNNPKNLAHLRRDILTNFKELPDMAEYLHRTIFDITEKYGKDTFLLVKYLGTKNIPNFFRLKAKIERVINNIPIFPSNILDKILFYLAGLFPKHLPDRMTEYRDRYEHHLIVSTSDAGIGEMQAYLEKEWSEHPDNDFFICNDSESNSALLHRFAAGGAAGNYQTIHKDKVGGILAIDVALRRNDEDWSDDLPEEISKDIESPLYYGHFLCNVFHRNYLLKKGSNKEKIKSDILTLLDRKGAKYPAEHNVGHLYEADGELRDFYRKLDPTNTFNPGIGKMEKHRLHCNCCL